AFEQWLARCSSSFATSPRVHLLVQYLQEALNFPEPTESPLLTSSQIELIGLPCFFFFFFLARNSVSLK
ncbi:2193_t:CDS:2, partial [Entrophospora sp. SA101]